jgi:hypothetical protein
MPLITERTLTECRRGTFARFESQLARTLALLTKVGEARAGNRYAPEKWSIREVIGHVIDAERILLIVLCALLGQKEFLCGF